MKSSSAPGLRRVDRIEIDRKHIGFLGDELRVYGTPSYVPRRLFPDVLPAGR